VIKAKQGKSILLVPAMTASQAKRSPGTPLPSYKQGRGARAGAFFRRFVAVLLKSSGKLQGGFLSLLALLKNEHMEGGVKQV